ncbi:MurR/RpiR family transcriptional regulator [Insolitispirillum peregrinum]|uniref:Transcriptional regulator, RpiR family n=1 Tax=Insolitispirillum peregrinum TaxID=80876 RepID=A0A1N7IIP4_9PROT|nr:MurR/RpiR family transcriptional regulator [Insolitispirillum peregrinum]SIS36920.1 transcriptional regulator, RpiR family [Insolitispirillum peregrinum]
MTVDVITTQLQQAYDSLSPQLRQGARYLLAHPEEVALTSMRRLAAHAGVKPSTMVRLARALGFEGFEELREPYRNWLRGGEGTYEARARALHARQNGEGLEALLKDMADADLNALEMACCENDKQRTTILAAAETLSRVRRVYVLGLRSCFSLAYSFHYGCSMLREDCRLVDGAGGTYLDGLRGIAPQDCLVVFSVRPYAHDTVELVELAHSAGAAVIAITDSPTAPIAHDARHLLIAETSSPNFFHSLVAPQALLQQVLGALTCIAGEGAVETLRDREQQLRQVEAYWQEPKRKRRV